MSSPAITTVVKMMESLPVDLQERVVEHIQEYINDIQEETRWQNSFQKTQTNLIAVARKAKQEIAAEKATEMDFDRL